MDFLHAQLAALQSRLSFVATEPIDWKFYVQAFSWAVTLFESYLLLRQYPLYSKTEPPTVLASHFDATTFRNSQLYGRDKARFSFVTGLLKQAIDSAMLHFGFYAWAWDIGGRIVGWFGYDGSGHQIVQSLVFAGVLFACSTVVGIPLSVYQTFVLEGKHGFNKTSPALFVTDLVKSFLLALVIGGPFLALFLYVFEWAGDRFVPWLMALLLAFQISMVILYPTVIQPLFNKLSPLPAGELRSRTESLARKLKFPLKHLYEIDGSKRSSHSNAYFFGLPWSKHIVIFDTLIKQSKPDEVEAVLAHELGHWYYMHPTKLLCVSQVHIFGVLALFPAFLHAPQFVRAFDFSMAVASKPPTIVAFLMFQMILTPIEAVIGIANNIVSRRFEWEADRFACGLHDRLGGGGNEKNADEDKGWEKTDMSDMGDRLGRALIALHVKNLSTVWVDWMYSAYHHSHPTLMERLKAIDGFKTERDAKKKKAI